MMVGIVLVGHCNLAVEFHKVVKSIVGEVENIQSVYLDVQETPDASMKKVAGAIQEADAGAGVLVITDMFGGTPSNLSLSFLEEGKVEVLTGVNLPMLIRLITLRKKSKNLAELARDLKAYGKRNICIASEILQKQKK
ncbi:PTS sugar transporter subunit IIA [Thermodesulfobacteriota bacterium]